MDRLEAMRLLLEVVERGSLSAAGRSLRVPVPTLSRKLTDLEKQLGARLLVRTTRNIGLTEAGAAYVLAARRILEQVEEAERAAAGEFQEPKGELLITAPVMFGRLHMLPLVGRFLARYPQIHVRLLLDDRTVHLVDDHVDLALRIGALLDSGLIATRLGSMRTRVCASPGLLEKVGVPRQPEDLSHLPCVTVDAALLAPNWRFRGEGGRGAQQVSIQPRLAVSTTDAALAAALAGVGFVRLLHYQVAEGLANGGLQAVLDEYELEPSPVHLMHVGHGRMPLKLRSFLDFAAPQLRALLEAEPSA